MQTEDDIILELEASDTEPKASSDAEPSASTPSKQNKSRFNLDHKQKGMLAMGAIVVLGVAAIFGPGLFSSAPQHHNALKPVSQQSTDEMQVVPLPVAPAESDLKKDVDGIRSQMDDVIAANNKEIVILQQLLAQNQHNYDQVIASLQKGMTANAQSVADAAKIDAKAKETLKHITLRRVAHRLPAFKINTIFPNEAWLQLGSLTYCVSPGDVIKGVRIIAIDPDTDTVTTSAGVIHR
ncbi:TPA: hypothetical protein ACF3I9_004468 [Klebsiella aerogenes]